MSRRLFRAGLVLAVLASAPPAGTAQEPRPRNEDVPHVFFDCQTFLCDYDHTRREIPYVNWVRDRQDADIHVLITALQTGGGGWEFTLEFIGLRALAGRRDTLRYVSGNTDTEDERRTGLTRIVRFGLVPFLAGTSVADRLDVTYAAPAEAAVAATAEDDPWNFWTFRLRASGSSNGESQQRFFSGNGSFSADRVTEEHKLTFSVSGFGYRSEFDVVDTTIGLDTTYVSTRTSYSLRSLAVWSLTPHWSAGVRVTGSRSSTVNQDLALSAGPAIEYNIFPYSESTRRQLTILYWAGMSAFDYRARTIFNETSEILPRHELEIGISATQPWGSLGSSVFGSQYLHDVTKYNVGISGNANVRIFRGLSFNTFGSVSRIKDQLYISQAGLTPEQILLQQSQRGTNFRYYINLGLSYRFGSKFANVVNTRMGGGGGGVFFFF